MSTVPPPLEFLAQVRCEVGALVSDAARAAVSMGRQTRAIIALKRSPLSLKCQ